MAGAQPAVNHLRLLTEPDLDSRLRQPRRIVAGIVTQGIEGRPGDIGGRQAPDILGGERTGNGITGTPTEIADFMEEWFEAGAADGFILMCPTLPASLTDFVELVLPELRRRGLFREEYEGKTLRDNLGLSMPKNRYTAARNA